MKRRFKLKLTVVQLLAYIPYLLFIFYSFDLWYDSQRALLFEQNIKQAQRVGEFIRNELNNGLRLANYLSHDENILTNQDEGKLRENLNNLAKSFPEIENILITDANGRPQAADFPLTEEQKNIDLSPRDYFREMLKSKKGVFSKPIKGLIFQKDILVIAGPIIRNDVVDGAVLISYNLQELKEKIENAFLPGEFDTVAVIDKDGRLVFILKRPLPEESERMYLGDYEIIRKAMQAEIGFIENEKIEPLSGNNLIGGAALVNNDTQLNWVVVSAKPITHVFDSLFRIQGVIWIIIIVSSVFSLALYTYYLRKVKIVY